MKALILALAFLGCVTANCQMAWDSDGNFYQQIGNTTYGSGPNGSASIEQIGDTGYSSWGTTYQTIGNTIFGSDGTDYLQIGNTTYGSDGSTMTNIGGIIY